jgi:hypothetical protein
MMERLDKEWLQLNAQLQKKKNAVRKALKEKGVLKKEGNNTYDKYSYFSEAQYKLLFTELFADNGLEMKFTELSYDTFEGSEKQSNGRMPKLCFQLIDMETGFFEETNITGEGIDKGDKAGYKAYTGALKYFLANTFMVATGDDPETDSPNIKMNNKKSKIFDEPVTNSLKSLADEFRSLYPKEDQERILNGLKLKRAEDIGMNDLQKYVNYKKYGKKQAS